MKNTYTFLFMSSNQESVRQFSIKRRFVLFLGIFAFLAFSLIIHFAVSGVKHGIRYQAELRGEVAGRAELERTIRQYKTEREAIKRDLQEVRRTERMVRKVLGIGSKDGILGQGGGGSNIEEENEDEPTNSSIETPSALAPVRTDFTNTSLVAEVIKVKRDIAQVYEHVQDGVQVYRETPFILPIAVPIEDDIPSYWFSSEFGRRPHPFTRKPQFHHGLDIAAPSGTPVLAAADGVIEIVKRDRYFGNMVQIEHKSTGMMTLYGHLKDYADSLQVGKQVKREEIIGYVGNSGRSTGTHLHYGVYSKGKWQDPRHYIILDDPSN